MPLSDTEMGELDALVRKGVVDGIREVMQDPEVLDVFWGSAATALRKSARERTGGFILGAVGGLFNKVLLFAFLAGIVYALGGLAAVGKLWAVLFGHHGG
jgi:hypothetical protein